MMRFEMGKPNCRGCWHAASARLWQCAERAAPRGGELCRRGAHLGQFGVHLVPEYGGEALWL